MTPRHLFNTSAYDFDIELFDGIAGMQNLVKRHGLHGIELLIGHDPVPSGFIGHVTGVHLPYAVDWNSMWDGGDHINSDLTDDEVRFLSYGRNREEAVECIRGFLRNAATLTPEYGVYHAGCPSLDSIFSQDSANSDVDILVTMSELLNEAMKVFPDGEPPFPLMLENLWWPGLRFFGESEMKVLEENLNFNRWGICLDVGHLMNSLRNCDEEIDAIEKVLALLQNLSESTLERIKVVHLHLSLSAEYQKQKIEEGESKSYIDGDFQFKLKEAFPHFSAVDWHAPFRSPRCTEIIHAVSPQFVTHEFISTSLEDLEEKIRIQHSHFSGSYIN